MLRFPLLLNSSSSRPFPSPSPLSGRSRFHLLSSSHSVTSSPHPSPSSSCPPSLSHIRFFYSFPSTLSTSKEDSQEPILPQNGEKEPQTPDSEEGNATGSEEGVEKEKGVSETNEKENEDGVSEQSPEDGDSAVSQYVESPLKDLTFAEREPIIFPPHEASRPLKPDVAPVDRDGVVIPPKHPGKIMSLLEPDPTVYASPTRFFRILGILLGIGSVLLVLYWDDLQKLRYDKDVHLLSVYLGAENYDEVLKLADRMLMNQAVSPEAHYYKGLARFLLGLYHESIQDFQIAIEGASCPMEIRSSCMVYAAVCFTELNQYEDALMLNTEALYINPDSTMAWRNRGELLFYLKQFEESLAAYEYSSTLEPSSSYPKMKMADVLIEMGRAKEALPLLEELISEDPFSVRLHLRLVKALREGGNTSKAIATANECLVMDPSNPQCYLEYGRTLLSSGQKDEAVAAFERASFLSPGNQKLQEELEAARAYRLSWLPSFGWS